MIGVQSAYLHASDCQCGICVEQREGKKIIKERDQIRGSFTEQAQVSQNLKQTFRYAPGWSRLTPSQREAFDNMANKMARILTGDPNEIDSWADISGYAELVLRVLREGRK